MKVFIILRAQIAELKGAELRAVLAKYRQDVVLQEAQIIQSAEVVELVI